MGRGVIFGNRAHQTVHHRTAGLLALFALLLHVAIPTLYDIAPPKVQGLMEMTICAGGEAKQIVIDANGKPVKETPANNHNCHSCMSHCGMAALAAVTTVVPQFIALVGESIIFGLPHGLFTTSKHARAPPL